MNQRIPLDHLTSDQLDHLYERAEQAEAALTRVQHVAALIHAGAPWTANRTDTAARIRAAIAGPGTAATEATGATGHRQDHTTTGTASTFG